MGADLSVEALRHPKSRMRQVPKFVVLQLLRGYKWAISPMFLPACRFVPTCSEYAMEAVERYGSVRGGWMALMRLLRCHPFAHGGFDPVVKVSVGHEEGANIPQGLKPALIVEDSSQRLKCCATQNHLYTQNHLGHPNCVRHPESQPSSLNGVGTISQGAV
jgi:putative membrane protein insertion efficiency factor